MSLIAERLQEKLASLKPRTGMDSPFARNISATGGDRSPRRKPSVESSGWNREVSGDFGRNQTGDFERFASMESCMPSSRQVSTGSALGGPAGPVSSRVVVRCCPSQSADGFELQLTEEKNGVRIGLSQAAIESPQCKAAVQSWRAIGQRSFRCHGLVEQSESDETVFEHSDSVIAHTMSGGTGAILAYGASGSNKSNMMFGSSFGMSRHVSERVFDAIKEKSAGGDVYIAEASFLLIVVNEDGREQFFDLFTDDEYRQLEVRVDGTNNRSFTCDGLRRMPISTADALCDSVHQGLQRRDYFEKAGISDMSRSHCIFTIGIESLSSDFSVSEPQVKRSKLMLVDLAGNESCEFGEKKDGDDSSQALVRRGLGPICDDSSIGKQFASLATAMNTTGLGLAQSASRESALVLLLRDCVGGAARSLLIANLRVQVHNIDEAVKTLSFSHQLVSIKSMLQRNVTDGLARSSSSKQSLQQQSLTALQEKVEGCKQSELHDKLKLQGDLETLNKHLSMKDASFKAVGKFYTDQMDQAMITWSDMKDTLSKELAQNNKMSQSDQDEVKTFVESKLAKFDGYDDSLDDQQVLQLQDELRRAQQAQQQTFEEMSSVRVTLASAKERCNFIQEKIEELRKERSQFEDERKNSRSQNDQLWQRLSSIEAEAKRFKAEAESQREEFSKLIAARKEDFETLQKGREAWRTREHQLQQEVFEVRRRYEEATRESQAKALRSEGDQRETGARLSARVESLQKEDAERGERLASRAFEREKLVQDCEGARRGEAELKQKCDFDLKRQKVEMERDLEEAHTREAELVQMLREVQDGIITAGQIQEHHENEEKADLHMFTTWLGGQKQTP